MDGTLSHSSEQAWASSHAAGHQRVLCCSSRQESEGPSVSRERPVPPATEEDAWWPSQDPGRSVLDTNCREKETAPQLLWPS